MSRTKGTRIAGQSHAILSIDLVPHSENTFVSISRSTTGPDGERRRRLAYWYLGATREQLAGLKTHDVLLRLVNDLLRSLESGADSYDRTAPAVGPGAPLGATGGTVTTTVRAVIEPTLDDGAWGPEKPSTLT